MRQPDVFGKNHSLDGTRFGQNANVQYSIPEPTWEAVKDAPNSENFLALVRYYVNDHYSNQLDRILELQRYYYGDNNIHHWQGELRNKNQSDNRIANPWATYITNLRIGHQFGNPIKYGFDSNDDNADEDEGEELLNTVAQFNRQINEPYHNRLMAINMFTTGRAYELMFIKEGTNEVHLTTIDPNSCFVVWSTDVEPTELFAVRYYKIQIAGQINFQVEVYTDNKVYYYDAGQDITGDLTLTKVEETYFNQVPITEFDNNPERMGVYERVLDKIDEYDQSESGMANNQEDFNNAQLLISGIISNQGGKAEPMLDDNGNQVYLDSINGGYTDQAKDKLGNNNTPIMEKQVLDTHSNVMYLKPYQFHDASGNTQTVPTTASYLTKNLNVTDWDKHRTDIANEIMQFTNTPNVTDANFAGNSSGVAMAYKLFGMDQEMEVTDSLFARGIHRRLRLLINYLGMQPGSGVKEDENANDVTITFTPNNPKNNQAIVNVMQSLASQGVVSTQTLQEMAYPVTGVPQSQEQERMDQQKADQAKNNPMAGINNKLFEQNMGNQKPPKFDPDKDGQSGGESN